VWQDRKHGEKVRLESHFDRVDVNSVDKSGESIIVTKSKCKHCGYEFTTPVSKVKKRALCHLLQVELCAGTSLSMIGLLLQIKEGSLAICNRDLSEPSDLEELQKDYDSLPLSTSKEAKAAVLEAAWRGPTRYASCMRADALDHIDHIFGRAQLRCLQKDHAGQVHHLI